jgi:hypothetical protein
VCGIVKLHFTIERSEFAKNPATVAEHQPFPAYFMKRFIEIYRLAALSLEVYQLQGTN